MSASDLPEPTIDQARQLGEKGSPARESERLLFEAWMGGHCWAIGGTWTGTQYKASDEDGLRVNQQAMLTRMLWAAWRDRGTLADDQIRAYGDKRAREAVEAERAKRREVLDLLHKARDMCFEEARRLEAIDPNTRAAPAFTDWGFGARQAGHLINRLAAAAWADYLDEVLPPYVPPPDDTTDGQSEMIERLRSLASAPTPGEKT